jgi:hypothetical protein
VCISSDTAKKKREISPACESLCGKRRRTRKRATDVALILCRVFPLIHTVKTCYCNGSVTCGRLGHVSTSLPCVFSLPCAILFLCRVQIFAVCILLFVPCATSLPCVFDMVTVVASLPCVFQPDHTVKKFFAVFRAL